MTFEEALKALKEGKKIRKKWWHAGSYIWLDEKNTLKNKNGIEICVSVDFDFMTKNEWEIYEEPVLDEVEKKYLSYVLRPFRDRIRYVVKLHTLGDERDDLYSLKNGEYLSITYGDCYYDFFTLPPFPKDSMYKNMETGKEYSLKELGL